jgi:hypothetical protein
VKSVPLSLEEYRDRPFYIKLADRFCGFFRALF